MSGHSPGLAAALKQSQVLVFNAIEIVLPSYTLRLLDGSGYVDFDGKTFRGFDETYGTLQSIEAFADGSDEQTPSLKVFFLPPTNTAAATLASVEAQGSPVNIWFGAIDPESGIVIDEPEHWFAGELDVPTLTVGSVGRILEYEVASVWERFFADDEGARLTDAYHQYLWPGERGLEFHTEVQVQLPWGSDLPRPQVIRDVSGTGGFQGYYPAQRHY